MPDSGGDPEDVKESPTGSRQPRLTNPHGERVVQWTPPRLHVPHLCLRTSSVGAVAPVNTGARWNPHLSLGCIEFAQDAARNATLRLGALLPNRFEVALQTLQGAEALRHVSHMLIQEGVDLVAILVSVTQAEELPNLLVGHVQGPTP